MLNNHTVFVHVPPSLDPDAYRDRWELGREPDESPYGFHLAVEFGYQLLWSRSRAHSSEFLARIADGVRRRFFGIDVLHALHNRAAIRKSSVVWTMLEQDALAIAVLMKLRLAPKRPIVTGVVWLFNEWESYSWLKRRVLRSLLRTISIATTHAEPCLKIAKQINAVDTRLIYFGISEDTFSPLPCNARKREKIVVFAMGNDRSRDWDTLLRAFGNDPRFQINMVCRWVQDEVTSRYSNLKLIRDPDIAAMRALYADADYAAITMHENRFSGITVALEAAALGTPILGTRTGGLRTYFSEDEMILADVGDDLGLKVAALSQSPDERSGMAARASAKFEGKNYTTRGMMRQYHAFTCELKLK